VILFDPEQREGDRGEPMEGQVGARKQSLTLRRFILESGKDRGRIS